MLKEHIVKNEGAKFAALFPFFPPFEMWRFVIDGWRHAEGPYAFDVGKVAEPGFLKSCLLAYDFIAGHLESPLSIDLISSLYQHATYFVSNKNYGFRQKNQDVKFKMIVGSKNPVADNFSLEGVKELAPFVQEVNRRIPRTDGQPSLFFVKSKDKESSVLNINEPEKLYNEANNNPCFLIARGITDLRLRNFMEEHLQQFLQEVAEVNDQDLKIKLIVKIVHQFELIHPMRDANCRTFLLLLNFLLVKFGMTPTMLANPNHLDGLSVDELIVKVKEGMLTFNMIRANCERALNNFLQIVAALPHAALLLSQLDRIFSQTLESLYLIEYCYQFANKIENIHYASTNIHLKLIYHERLIAIAQQITPTYYEGFLDIVGMHALGQRLLLELRNCFGPHTSPILDVKNEFIAALQYFLNHTRQYRQRLFALFDDAKENARAQAYLSLLEMENDSFLHGVIMYALLQQENGNLLRREITQRTSFQTIEHAVDAMACYLSKELNNDLEKIEFLTSEIIDTIVHFINHQSGSVEILIAHVNERLNTIRPSEQISTPRIFQRSGSMEF